MGGNDLGILTGVGELESGNGDGLGMSGRGGIGVGFGEVRQNHYAAAIPNSLRAVGSP